MHRIIISLVVAILTVLPTQPGLAATGATTGTEDITAKTASNLAVGQFETGAAAPLLNISAQVTTTTPTRSARPTPTQTITATAEVTRLRPITVQLLVATPATPTPVVTATAPITSAAQVTRTAPVTTSNITTSNPISPTAPEPDPDAAYAGQITGTIIANRTEANLRFFVEGATYDLAPLRSLGVELPRATAVLNLYNCDANTPEGDDCFWDPYPLKRDGFYEVINATGINLSLREAGEPPADRIWVQNRTGQRETVFYNNEVYELPPSSVQEFIADPNSPTVLIHLRSCVSVEDKRSCEWAPRNVRPGYYYALVAAEAPAELPNSTINTLDIQSVLPSAEVPEVDAAAPATTTATTTVTTEAPPVQAVNAPTGTITCRVQVPTVNIRSGPGLQYQVIGKVQSTEQEPGIVTVIGRDETSQWLAVTNDISPGGWITASPGFLQCTDDITALPPGQITDGRLEPTPEAPVVVATDPNAAVGQTEASSDDPAAVESTEAVTDTTPSAPPSIGPGQALLIVNNGFDQAIRFTLDQRYRVEVGASEFDLQPGQSTNIVVYAGQIAFSASSAWNGLAGNAEFFLDNQQSRDLWIYFIPDPDESGNWILQF